MKINELFEEIQNDTPNHEISVDFTAIIGKYDKSAFKLLDVIYKSLPDNSTFGDADKLIDDMKWWNVVFNTLAEKHENLQQERKDEMEERGVYLTQVDEVELTKLFVELADLRKRQAQLEEAITLAVLQRCETVKVAGITASYYRPGFETPDYEAAVKGRLPVNFDLDLYTTTKKYVQWLKVCNDLGIIPPAGPAKPARVVIK